VKPVRLLDRPIYEASEAARLLRIPSRTFRNWLDGYNSGGSTIPPVIRHTSTGMDLVTQSRLIHNTHLVHQR